MHGSILMFGKVCKDKHADSPKAEERDEHHHFPCYTSLQHYWKPVAKKSLEAYGVKLHAACHEGYTSMYVYVSHTSKKKKAHDIDLAPYYSPAHPKGEALRKLLEVGARSCGRFTNRKRSADGTHVQGRFRSGEL